MSWFLKADLMFCFPTYFAHHEKKKISPLMGQALDGLSKEHSYKNTHKKNIQQLKCWYLCRFTLVKLATFFNFRRCSVAERSATDGSSFSGPRTASVPTHPDIKERLWCAARAISQPLVRVLSISARNEGQSTVISPIEMTSSRYRATSVLNSWTICITVR